MKSEPNSAPVSLRERLLQRREDRKAQKGSPASMAVQGYLEAAAVLTDFDPDLIQPAWPTTDVTAKEALSRVSQIVISENQVRWTLMRETRQRVLQALHNSQAMLAALQPNRGQTSTLEQRIYEQLFSGRWDYIQFTGERQLAAALEATQWLSGVLPYLPDLDELRRRLAYARFAAPFERLAGSGFVGRTEELQRLHDYVGALELSSSSEKIIDTFRGWLLKPKRGPLVVHGPGGVGKSALIARFILDQDSNRLAFGGFPIVYLDFDNSSLQLDHPESLVKEAFRQAALQYPQLLTIQSEFLSAYENFVASQADAATPPSSATGTAQALRFQAALPFVSQWMPRLLHVRAELNAPFLIVFDTFEEVVSRNRLAIEQVLTLCTLLQNLYSQTRIVISGRALETSFGNDLSRAWGQLQVKDFDALAAQAYLVKLGVEGDIAQTIVTQLGGSPLTLKLAVEAVSRGVQVEQNAGFKNLQTRSWLLFSASETVIQGQLYERILGHIRDREVPEVRKLAFPGLVLRRLTPEIISEVLAAPCKLTLPSEPEARKQATQNLFDALRKETFLVDPRGVNSLRHRTDIRRVMLDLIETKDRALTRSIHESAVNYYFQHGATPEERAEEIYHRLKLGQETASVSARWMNGVEDYLGDAIQELPPGARLFLASRLGVKLKDEESLFREAGLEEWELFTARKVNEAIAGGRPESVLALLRERTERTARSPLFELEANVLIKMGRYQEAGDVLEHAIHSVAATGDRRGLSTLLSLLASIRVQMGQYASADGLYRRIIDMTADPEERLLRLTTMLNRINSAVIDPKDLQTALAELSQTFLSSTDEELRAVKAAAVRALITPSSAQTSMILRAIEAGLCDDLLSNPSELPVLRQLAVMLVQQSWTQPEAMQKAAALLFFNRASA